MEAESGELTTARIAIRKANETGRTITMDEGVSSCCFARHPLLYEVLESLTIFMSQRSRWRSYSLPTPHPPHPRDHQSAPRRRYQFISPLISLIPTSVSAIFRQVTPGAGTNSCFTALSKVADRLATRCVDDARPSCCGPMHPRIPSRYECQRIFRHMRATHSRVLQWGF